MVKEICKDESFLRIRSELATADDTDIAVDLLDTLAAHKESCVGMAANMIGVSKRIIVFDDNGEYTVMLNPLIIKSTGVYIAEEGCLSLDGVRSVKRFDSIKVEYRNMRFQLRYKNFKGRTAEIIQHEIDHCDGIII